VEPEVAEADGAEMAASALKLALEPIGARGRQLAQRRLGTDKGRGRSNQNGHRG